MRLNDTIIRNAKPGARPRKLSDGHGLYLLVQPNGARWWRKKYFFEGREQVLSVASSCEYVRGSDEWWDRHSASEQRSGYRSKSGATANQAPHHASITDPSQIGQVASGYRRLPGEITSCPMRLATLAACVCTLGSRGSSRQCLVLSDVRTSRGAKCDVVVMSNRRGRRVARAVEKILTTLRA